MNNIFKGFIFSAMALLNLTFISCGDDDEDIKAPLPDFIEHLPSAENIKATTAFIPVNASLPEGTVELYWGSTETGLRDGYVSTNLDRKLNGFQLSWLEPDQTYYYTIAYYPPYSNEPVYSKEIKSFKTKGVGIQFTDLAITSEGNRPEYALRIKVTGLEETDALSNMYVSLYSAYTDNSGYITHGICSLRYLGDAVWEYEAIDEYDSYSYQNFKGLLQSLMGEGSENINVWDYVAFTNYIQFFLPQRETDSRFITEKWKTCSFLCNVF